MAQRPLDGIRVLDLSVGPVGGVATMVLADFGAEVIRVERPGGDPFRALPNAPMWLRGKHTIELDLASPGGKGEVARLAGEADAVVSTFHDDRARRLGCDAATLRAANPRLIYARITPFGPKGPYRDYPGYEGVVAAKSGRMLTFQGIADREGPAYSAVQVAMHATSQSTVAGILAALHERGRSGEGQVFDTSMLQGMLPYELVALLRAQLLRLYPERFQNDPYLANGMRSPTLNYHPLQAGDGRWMQMGNLLQHLFDNYLSAVDLMDIYAEERYQGPPATWREADREELRERMFLRMREKTADEWTDIFVQNGGVAATIYRPTQDALTDPDLVMNGHVAEREHPELGKVVQLGPVATLMKTPGSASEAEVRNGAAAWASAPFASKKSANANGHGAGPLAGVTIVEFATIIAAPLGVAMLGDLGARVIKVEPIGGDPYRGMAMMGIMAARTNGSKESIALDLKSEEGQQVVAELVKNADILIHNYRPGVPERLGIGYEQCVALRPDITYVSVNGYGPKGPGAHRPSTHPIPGAALGGAYMQTGAGRPPTKIGTMDETRRAAEQLFRANEANPDPNTSVVVTTAALLGLTAARRLGTGQQVFVDMMATNSYANADDFISYAGKPDRAWPDHDLYGLSATYRLYQAKEGWVFLALVQEKELAAFANAIGQHNLWSDARFATPAARKEHDAELAEALGEILSQRTADEWEALLAPQGIGCVRADTALPGDFWADDPHVRENGFAPSMPHARYGEVLRWGTQQTFERTPLAPRAACLAGDHTDAILSELGYSEEEVTRLRAEGIAWSEPVGALG
jgi:crotonobetainyl-CoA:carnitine CoA-transferase CaiB-like acyl-CoA transferase